MEGPWAAAVTSTENLLFAAFEREYTALLREQQWFTTHPRKPKVYFEQGMASVQAPPSPFYVCAACLHHASQQSTKQRLLTQRTLTKDDGTDLVPWCRDTTPHHTILHQTTRNAPPALTFSLSHTKPTTPSTPHYPQPQLPACRTLKHIQHPTKAAVGEMLCYRTIFFPTGFEPLARVTLYLTDNKTLGGKFGAA